MEEKNTQRPFILEVDEAKMEIIRSKRIYGTYQSRRCTNGA